MAYSYQSVDHDASISAERDPDDTDVVEVEIVIGEMASVRIRMWAEEFEQMARGVSLIDVGGVG